MRKIFITAALILAMCSVAAAQTAVITDTAVVIIGGAEFKTPEYYKMIQSTLRSKGGLNCEVGDDMQKKYQRFMMETYDLGNTAPKKKDLVNFAANSGYKRTLYLVIDENIDTQQNAKTRQKNRVSVQLDAYLCNSADIIDMATASRDDNSKTSILRARKSAFQKCLTDAVKSMGFRA